MKDQDFTRILAAIDGYWPTAKFKDNARKAWRHLLTPHPVERILEALAAYAAEGHPHPPMAGQLAARISPAKNSEGESELDRVRRQKARAREAAKAGSMTKRDFDFYQDDYWGPVEAAAAMNGASK